MNCVPEEFLECMKVLKVHPRSRLQGCPCLSFQCLLGALVMAYFIIWHEKNLSINLSYHYLSSSCASIPLPTMYSSYCVPSSSASGLEIFTVLRLYNPIRQLLLLPHFIYKEAEGTHLVNSLGIHI